MDIDHGHPDRWTRAIRPRPRRRAERLVTWAAALVLGCACWPRSAAAFDLSASAIVYWTSTETLTSSGDNTEQRYSLELRQELAPFLELRLGYRHFDFSSQFNGAEAARRNRVPLLELLYRRPAVSGSLLLERNSSDGGEAVDSFEADSLAATISWRASRRLSLTAQFRDTSNVADITALGRDVDQQVLSFDARYQRRNWSLGYDFDRNDLENRSTDFSSVQDRHEVNLTANRDLFDDRVSLGFAGSVSRLDSRQLLGAGARLGEPVPALQGLFAIDPAPESGELDPAPGLIDGDFLTPSPPGIDIGGANTFRNIGLDLGLIRPISILEISVDRPSGAALVWAVYRSPDNLIWEPVVGVSSRFDAGIQRYLVSLPETSDRFFKVVNLSANPVSSVLVTELRALREVEDLPGQDDLEATLYRADVSLSFRPSPRVSARVNLGGTNDEDVVAGLVRRDYEERHGSARISVLLTPDLEASAGYRYTDSENRAGAELFRTSEVFEGGLRWSPLSTVEALLTARRRDDHERTQLIQSTDSIGLILTTDLLPDLSLTSRIFYSELQDPIGATDRTTWSWREDVRAQPTSTWTLDGGVGYSLTESQTQVTLLERTFANLRSTWNPTAYLGLQGDWGYSLDNDASSFRQGYGVFYAPGPKLSVNLFYEEYRADFGRRTATQSISTSYRLSSRVQVLGSWTRSDTEIDSQLTSRSDSLQAGLSVFF